MGKRKIIKIDEAKCNGCGQCLPNCPEGAIQIIDGKARLISDLFCDGLGACIGHCPVGAITIEEREAVDYDEVKTMDNIIKGGINTIKAHLKHLQDHGETIYLKQATEALRLKGIELPETENMTSAKCHTGCPGSRGLFESIHDEYARSAGEPAPSDHLAIRDDRLVVVGDPKIAAQLLLDLVNYFDDHVKYHSADADARKQNVTWRGSVESLLRQIRKGCVR